MPAWFNSVTLSVWSCQKQRNEQERNEVSLRLPASVPLTASLLACVSVQAKPKFNLSEIAAQGSDLMICDLDGDGLQDLVLLNDTQLCIFYQDPKRGFTREPQQTYSLEVRPCVVWTDRLGGPAGSVLVMNSDGVNELCFSNRTGPPAIRQIIRQPTIIPDAGQDTNAVSLSLSAGTGGHWPLLLVPAADGLQVWEHRDTWRRAQVIPQSVDASLRPSLDRPGTPVRSDSTSAWATSTATGGTI